MNPPSDERDQEIEYLRQQVQELIRRLAGFDCERDEVCPSKMALRWSSEGEYDWRYGRHSKSIDLKVDIPDFEGNSQPKRLHRLDALENKKVNIIATKLKKDASLWWEQLRARQERMGKPKINTWKKIKKKLKEKYIPANYLRSLYQKMHVLHQGDRLVDEYTDEFHLLIICNVVVLQQCWTLDEVYNLKKRVDTQQKQPSNNKVPWTKKGLLQESGDPKGVQVATSSATSCPNHKFVNLSYEFSDEDSTHSFEGDLIYNEPVDEEDAEITYNDRGEALKMTAYAQTYFTHIVLHMGKAIDEEFTDVIPEGLPPMQNINHHMDLIPSSSLPNKAAYRMSPKEHEELHRQVSKLLKGVYQGEYEPMCNASIVDTQERWFLAHVCGVWTAGKLIKSP
ncbi:hypothetical protein AMTRI_Chr08g160180 [Amborella trichopoda]